MERIARSRHHERLLRTLERRTARPFATIGPVARAHGDLAEDSSGTPTGSEHFSEALDLAPDDAEVLERLVHVFEKAGRYEDLAELLRERAIIEKSPAARAILYRKLGVMLATHVGDADGAIDAYEKLLAIEPDADALDYLCARARERGEHEKLVSLLKRSSQLVQTTAEHRDVEHEQALILRDELDRKREALAIWRTSSSTSIRRTCRRRCARGARKRAG